MEFLGLGLFLSVLVESYLCHTSTGLQGVSACPQYQHIQFSYSFYKMVARCAVLDCRYTAVLETWTVAEGHAVT